MVVSDKWVKISISKISLKYRIARIRLMFSKSLASSITCSPYVDNNPFSKINAVHYKTPLYK